MSAGATLRVPLGGRVLLVERRGAMACLLLALAAAALAFLGLSGAPAGTRPARCGPR